MEGDDDGSKRQVPVDDGGTPSGTMTSGAAAAETGDLVLSGTLFEDAAGVHAAAPADRGDDPTPTSVTLTLVVPAAVRRTGQGAISMTLEADDLRITEATLIWIVTTNKGWAHLRGSAGTGPGSAARPFRADLFAACLVPGTDDDRVALRVYEPGADPNVAGPTHKLQGRLPRGTIRLGR